MTLGAGSLAIALASAVLATDTWPPLDQREFAEASVRLGGGYRAQMVPPFLASPRNRGDASLALGWAPADVVRLDLRWNWLWDELPTGERRQGPGDIRVATDVQVWRGPVDARIAWQLKLPNAADEEGLGTDETDGIVLGAVLAPVGIATVGLTGGLAIVGNPVLVAEQDDVPLSWLTARLPVGPVALFGRGGGEWKTPRNPPRMEAVIGVEGGCPWASGVSGGAGLTPASPTWQARAWMGWQWGCPGS